MKGPVSIALVASKSLDYCRNVLRGVTRYARGKDEWLLTPVEPRGKAIDGLAKLNPTAVIAHVFSEELADVLKRLRRPVINVSGVFQDLPFPHVTTDELAVGEVAASHLIDCGLRHFGFVGHPNHGYSVQREIGFSRRLATAPHTLDRYHQKTPPTFDPTGGVFAFDSGLKRWIEGLPKPVGIFACNDHWGLRLTEVCRELRLTVPDDVAIVGVDNDNLLCEIARPSLSSISIAGERIGYEAAGWLERMISGHKMPSARLRIPPVGLVARQSSDLLAVGDPDLAAALRYIRNHANEPIRVSDVLREVPVSRRYLERRFQQLLGRSPFDEIRRIHIDRAKHLLASTELPLSLVAERAGFSEPKQLSNVFHQEVGMTPSDYRAQFRIRA